MDINDIDKPSNIGREGLFRLAKEQAYIEGHAAGRSVNAGPATDTYVITGEDKAVEIATALVRNSAYYHLQPLPDDEWEFKVRQNEQQGVFNV